MGCSRSRLTVALAPYETIAGIACRETVMLFPFVLKHALLQIARNSDVKRMATTVAMMYVKQGPSCIDACYPDRVS